MKTIKILSLFLCISNLSYGHGHHHDDHDHEEFTWTEEKSEYAQIQIERAAAGAIQNYALVSAKVLVHPDSLAFANPKASGTVSAIFKNVGDVVLQGETLAILESQEIADAKSHYLRTSKKYELQKILYEQEKQLRGISTLQEYLQAEIAYGEALLDLEEASQTLYAKGFNEEDLAKMTEEHPAERRVYVLKAPLSGKVIQRNLTVGEFVEDTNHTFTVANFDKLWVEMKVAPNDVQYLKEGLPVKISAGEKQREVSVCKFDPMINEETRKAIAIAVMDNQDQLWTAGEYVTAHIQTESTPAAIVVAREAIQRMDGIDYVFIKEECGHFAPCPVKLGKMDHNHVEVLSGLEEGMSYVSCNAFCLKADFQKEEAEHSH